MRSDYTHVNRFVDRGRRIKPRLLLRGDEHGAFSRSNRPLLLRLPQVVRFLRVMRMFRRHYEAFKRDCLVQSQAQAIKSDPFLWDLYREPASQFVERHRIEDLSRLYLAPAVRGTAFTPVASLTAFTFLVGMIDFVVPVFEYTFRFDHVTEGFGDALVIDTVTELTPAANQYVLRRSGGDSVTADNVVVATPIDVSARLLGLGPVKRPVSAHIFLVDGQLRPPWSSSHVSLFPPGDPILALAQQPGGSVVVSAATEEPDFARIFRSWEVVEHRHWDPAFHLLGDELLECEQRPGLYLIGDHNVCDLEDACITGIHAANRIIGSDG